MKQDNIDVYDLVKNILKFRIHQYEGLPLKRNLQLVYGHKIHRVSWRMNETELVQYQFADIAEKGGSLYVSGTCPGDNYTTTPNRAEQTDNIRIYDLESGKPVKEIAIPSHKGFAPLPILAKKELIEEKVITDVPSYSCINFSNSGKELLVSQRSPGGEQFSIFDIDSLRLSENEANYIPLIEVMGRERFRSYRTEFGKVASETDLHISFKECVKFLDTPISNIIYANEDVVPIRKPLVQQDKNDYFNSKHQYLFLLDRKSRTEFHIDLGEDTTIRAKGRSLTHFTPDQKNIIIVTTKLSGTGEVAKEIQKINSIPNPFYKDNAERMFKKARKLAELDTSYKENSLFEYRINTSKRSFYINIDDVSTTIHTQSSPSDRYLDILPVDSGFIGYKTFPQTKGYTSNLYLINPSSGKEKLIHKLDEEIIRMVSSQNKIFIVTSLDNVYRIDIPSPEIKIIYKKTKNDAIIQDHYITFPDNNELAFTLDFPDHNIEFSLENLSSKKKDKIKTNVKSLLADLNTKSQECFLKYNGKNYSNRNSESESTRVMNGTSITACRESSDSENIYMTFSRFYICKLSKLDFGMEKIPMNCYTFPQVIENITDELAIDPKEKLLIAHSYITQTYFFLTLKIWSMPARWPFSMKARIGFILQTMVILRAPVEQYQSFPGRLRTPCSQTTGSVPTFIPLISLI